MQRDKVDEVAFNELVVQFEHFLHFTSQNAAWLFFATRKFDGLLVHTFRLLDLGHLFRLSRPDSLLIVVEHIWNKQRNIYVYSRIHK